jgi:AcrR family transcriptional regulator
MSVSASGSLEPRKEPRQERSRRMQARILEAAVRVLADEGALGFTTTRVADEAGISVGSLYQYFPNKHSLVVAIHRDAIRRGWEHVQAVLDSPAPRPRQKVIEIARWFFATESAEANEIGAVFDDVEVFLRDRDTHGLLDREALQRFTHFVADASRARLAGDDAEFAAQLLMATLEAVGKSLATRKLTTIERERWATNVATMLCNHLQIGEQ